MVLLDRIYIKYIKFCVKYCIRISQIPNLNGEQSDMSIYKTLERDHP